MVTAAHIKTDMKVHISTMAGELIAGCFEQNSIVNRFGTAICRIVQNLFALEALSTLPAGTKLLHRKPRILAGVIATAVILPLANAFLNRNGIIKSLDRWTSVGAKFVNIGRIWRDIEDFRGHLAQAQDIVKYMNGYLSDLQRADIARKPSMFNTFKEIISPGSYKVKIDQVIKTNRGF